MADDEEIIWEAAWNDPTICLLKRFFYHAVECLREIGDARSDDLLKPIFFPGSISCSLLARKALQLEGVDLITNARLVSFGHDYLAFGGQGLVLYEKAVVKRSDHCLVQDGPPDACVHCRLGGPVECRIINPEHVLIMTSSMTNGFRNCEWHIKNGDQIIENQKDYGRKIKDLPPNPLDTDQRLQLAREVLTYYYFFTMMAIVENYGTDELLRLMRYRMFTEGMRFHVLKNKWGKNKLDDDIRQEFIDVFKILAIKSENVRGDGLEQMVISECPFSSFPPYVCQIVEMFFEGICKAHATSNEFIQVERMTEGAPHCRYVLRERSSSDRKWSDG